MVDSEKAGKTKDTPLSETKQKMALRKVILISVSVACVLVAVIIIMAVLLTKKGCSKCMAVATDNDVCTQIGGDTLSRGGSAVDATIAILLCLGAVQPQSNGIGGGGFMLIHTRTEDKVINFREKAPAAATQNMFVGQKEASVNGPLASGIPGPVRGHWAAHQKYGSLTWEELFKPSIKILREGINVTGHMENALRVKKKCLIQDVNFKAIFFTSDSEESYKKAGDNFTNPRLADVYERISKEGVDAFYTGSIADNIVKATGVSVGGIMTKEDLVGYTVSEDEPFKFEYRGEQIISAPPPASGHVIALTLQLLDKFSISSFSKVRAWNYIIEAMRFGFAMRSKTGDMAFSDTTKEVFRMIKNHSYADNILTSELKAVPSTGFITPYNNINKYSDSVFENYDGTHTTHVSVIGPDGEAVACTSTVNLYFGSCIMTDNGIVMNNQMDDFSSPGSVNSFGYAPSPENFIAPGKRPMSSSSPTIVFDRKGEATFVTGAAGGSRIISGTLLSLINALDWKMTLKDNLKAARIHDQLTEKTYYETQSQEFGVVGLDTETLEAIGKLGYNMTAKNGYLSIVTSVSKLLGKTEASGDSRKKGSGRVV